MTNHLIDPTFFYDAVEEFSFNYTIYVRTGKAIDSYGNTTSTYTTQTIRGSLQSEGSSLSMSKEGNTIKWDYNFYCKSLYRIDIGDYLEYKGNFFRVESVHDYDEFGVRSASLSMIQLTANKDLADYVAYLRGDKLV